MTIEQLEHIEREHEVGFTFNPVKKIISVKGGRDATGRALELIKDDRDEVATILRRRQGIPDEGAEIIEREVAFNVLSLAVQKRNYLQWIAGQPKYYQRTPDEVEVMWAQLQEGDQVVFDFAFSISVRRADGSVFAVNQKGEIQPASPYSPIWRS